MDFSEEERELLNLIRPHLMQAYANADAMTTFERRPRRFSSSGRRRN